MQEEGIQGAALPRQGWRPRLWGSGQGQGGRLAPKGGKGEWGCYRASLAPLPPPHFQRKGESRTGPPVLVTPSFRPSLSEPCLGVQGQ